jgi:lactoylglutathione lyase
VLDERRSTEFYKKAFGLVTADRIDFDSFTLVYLSNAETEFELTVNKGHSEPYNLGDGYGHLAVVVNGIEAEHKRIETAGLAPDGRFRQSVLIETLPTRACD